MGDGYDDLRDYLMDYCGTAGSGCGVVAVAGGFGDLENAPGLREVLDDVEGDPSLSTQPPRAADVFLVPR